MRDRSLAIWLVASFLVAVPFAAGIAAAQSTTTEKPVIYGVVMTNGDPPKPAPASDASAIEARSYLTDGAGSQVIEITREGDQVIVLFPGLPRLPVVFPTEPPPPRSFILVFQLSGAGNPVLKGFVSGDVAGEVQPLDRK